MESSFPSISYTCAPTIFWVRDSDRIIIVNELDGSTHQLTGREAIVWSHLALRIDSLGLIEMLATLLGQNREIVENELSLFFRRWQALGLLAVNESDHG